MPSKRVLPSLDRINECIKYHPRSGKCESLNGNKFYVNETGYLMVTIDKKLYCLHRIIWKIITGEDPGKMCVDHWNRDKKDNRKSNLRLSTLTQNIHNRSGHKRSVTGRKGVSLTRMRRDGSRGYTAKIRANGVRYHLGTYEDADAAQIAYMKAAIRLHKEFACLN